MGGREVGRKNWTEKSKKARSEGRERATRGKGGRIVRNTRARPSLLANLPFPAGRADGASDNNWDNSGRVESAKRAIECERSIVLISRDTADSYRVCISCKKSRISTIFDRQ